MNSNEKQDTSKEQKQEWPKKVVWLGIPRWECSNGVLWQEDSYTLAKEYQEKLASGQ